MLQKQSKYYHARFFFQPDTAERESVGLTASRYLQHCKEPSQSRLPVQDTPLRMYLIQQIMAEFQVRVLRRDLTILERRTFTDVGRPHYVFKLDDCFFATLQKQMHQGNVWATFYYLSDQFDEYYQFATAYTNRTFNFFDPVDASQEMMSMLLANKFHMIDYSTQLIPE